MATYVFSYRNFKGYAPTPETRARWMAWLEGMGDALVDVGRPVSARAGLGNCDSGTTELAGYSMVEAPDLNTAVTLAQGCPGLDRNGGVEIGELTEIAEVAELTGPRQGA